MSRLINTTLDDIYNKIMLILIANEGKLYDQYRLYSLVLDKFVKSESEYVPPEFKYKFFIIIRQLMIKNDNIRVFKENNIYQIIYNAPKDIKLDDINFNSNWIDISQLNNYIIDNDNDINFNYKDPESGNTIYHDILSDNNCENVKKLLEKNNIDYNIKNNYDKTPIECIKHIQVATIIINDLNNKLNQFEQKLKIIESKNNIANISLIDFIKYKIYIFIMANWNYIFYIFILTIFYLMIKFIL